MNKAINKKTSKPLTKSRGSGNANVLFLRALETLKAMKLKPPSKNSDTSAMVCVVFAVAAVETFVYELGEEAFRLKEWKPSVDEHLYGLGELIRDLEEAKFQLVGKVLWVVRYLTGKRPDRGSAVFQDFDLLVRLRNTIIHLKDAEEFLWYDDGSMDIEGTPKVIPQLESRKLIRSPYQPSWIVAISTTEIAEWSCRTAARMVKTLVDMLPDSDFKQMVGLTCLPLRHTL